MAYTVGPKKVNDDFTKSTYTSNGEEMVLHIRRSGSPDWLKAQEKLERPHRKAINRDKLPTKTRREINLRALAQTVLVGWEGVVDEDGNDVKYGEEIGFLALKNDPELLEHVIDFSGDIDNFRTEAVKREAKKSLKL